MKPKLGSGERFKQLMGKLEKKGNSADSARRIAASIGRAKYGNKKMNSMAKKGRNR